MSRNPLHELVDLLEQMPDDYDKRDGNLIAEIRNETRAAQYELDD
jgi:glycerophosphoryl diester phosphodiesterase